VVVYFTVKVFNILVRVVARHPTSPPFLAALGSCLVLLSLACVTAGRVDWLNALAVLSIGGLLLTARAVELYHDPLLQRPWTRARVFAAPFTEPWWHLDDQAGRSSDAALARAA